MAGPWEQFSSPQAAAQGPWAKFATAAPSAYVQPEPPPGEIIHGANQSYISDRPEISTTRPAEDPTGRDTAVTMNVLQNRRDNADSVVDTLTRTTSPLRQGYTFNAGDEILSALFGGINAVRGNNFNDAYDYSQELQRQELARMRDEYPVTSAVAEVGGGLASGYGLAKNGVTIVGNMSNQGVRNLAPRMLAGAAEGAAYGGVSGFAGADGGLSDRTDQAISNLPIAAGVGALAVPATDLVSAVLGRLAPIFNRDPAGRGDELLARNMVRDSQSPDDLAQAVEAAQAAGQGEYRAVDAANRNTQRLGAMAAKVPGEARNEISQTLAARQQGQGQRIGGYVDDALGAQGPDAYATEQGIVNSRRTAAQPLYDEAYKAPVPQGQFYDETLSRQSVRDAIQSAEKTAAEKQVPVTELFADVPNPNPQTRQVPSGVLDASGNPIMKTEVIDPTVRVPTVRGWDFIKRELDAKVTQLYKAGDTTAAEAVKETRNSLRDTLGKDVPKYGEALAKYSDDSSSLEAIQTGRDLINARNADEAKAAFREIPENKRDLPKIGASREVGVKLENQRAGQDKTLTFDTPNMQGKLDALVEDPVARAVLDQQINRERDMVRAGRAMTGGSSTFENMADGEAVSDAGGVLAALMSGNIPRAIGLGAGQAVGALSRRAVGMNEDVANRVTDYLMSADPQQIRSLADLFGQLQEKAYAPSVAPAVISAGANAPRTGTGDSRKER